MDYQRLAALEDEFASKDKIEDDDVEKLTSLFVNHNKNQNDPQLDETELRQYFKTKSYTHLEIPSDPATVHENEQCFFQNLQQAAFLKYDENSEAVQPYLKRAGDIKGRLDGTLVAEELKFVNESTSLQLRQKLEADYLTTELDDVLRGQDGNQHVGSSVSLVGRLLYLAKVSNNSKKKLVGLYHCQYLLYEVLKGVAESNSCGYPKLAGKLGEYLVKKTSDVKYQSLQVWCHYHNGNIFLENHPEEARQEFEKALEIAAEIDYHFAIMSMRERLGLVHVRLGKPGLARAFFVSAEMLSNHVEIKRRWASQTQVCCSIGLGNSLFPSARADGVARKTAESSYQRAIEIADSIGDMKARRVAEKNLAELRALSMVNNQYQVASPVSPALHG